MPFAQKIRNIALSATAVHNACAKKNTIAQNEINSVLFTKAMHNTCAINWQFAKKLGVLAPLRKNEKVCN